jgi:hypothetical protein
MVTLGCTHDALRRTSCRAPSSRRSGAPDVSHATATMCLDGVTASTCNQSLRPPRRVGHLWRFDDADVRITSPGTDDERSQ